VVNSRIIERLRQHPEIACTTRDGYLEVPPRDSSGFCVWVQENADGWTVGFEGWHEEFDDPNEAIECFAFGLSNECRLQVTRCCGFDYRWQLQHLVEGAWRFKSEVRLLFPTLLLPKKTRILQNLALA
jgi:hypothetical protein